jgi:hypothetical protein
VEGSLESLHTIWRVVFWRRWLLVTCRYFRFTTINSVLDIFDRPILLPGGHNAAVSLNVFEINESDFMLCYLITSITYWFWPDFILEVIAWSDQPVLNYL